MNYLPRLASKNPDPPDLCLLSNQDYRCEPPALGSYSTLLLSLKHFPFMRISFVTFKNKEAELDHFHPF
jgi:hypothetical protein